MKEALYMAVNGSVSKDLSSKQAKYVDALLVGSTVIVAAKTAGISPRTAARWKRDQIIQQELAGRRKSQFNETLDAFRAGLPTAMALVLDTIKDKETPRSVRLRAAQIWIEHALEIHKVEELENRIAMLEERLRP
jgi:phage terminase small subunit